LIYLVVEGAFPRGSARRGVTPLFHTNMTPYGDVQLRSDRRLDLSATPPSNLMAPPSL
jgi:hypothetical protein